MIHSSIYSSLYIYVENSSRSTCAIYILSPDNGTEFSDPSAIETAPDGSQQKGACENNHEIIRRIILHDTDTGKSSREQIALMINHVNSYGCPDLNDLSPYEVFEFHCGEKVLDKPGSHRIPQGKIILRPTLLK